MPQRPTHLILASASPRRRQLLEQSGYQIEVVPSGIEEAEPADSADPGAYAAQLAFAKARAVARTRSTGLVLAADTVCAVDQVILNKPCDRADAERMIRLQEGRETKVVTALVLYRSERHEWLGAIETSTVWMRPLSNQERNAYLDSGAWQGKAGAYGVQDDDPIVTVTSGSWSNVVGLPLERLKELLARLEGTRGLI